MNDIKHNIRQPFCFAKLHGDMGLTKTYFGRKIIINTKNIYTLNLIDNGIIEGAICKIFEDHLKPGAVVVDAGANIGFLSLLAGHLVGPTGHVVSIEANPDVFQTLDENIRVNGFAQRTSMYQLAAFDQETELNFTWNSHRDGSGRIVTPTQAGLAEKHCKVTAQTLDKICEKLRVDFIKIDTEGAEPYVMRGAKQLITANPDIKIVLEWNSKHIMKRGQQPEEFAKELFNQFKFIKEIRHKDLLIPLSLSELLELPHSNLFVHN